jgi:glycosyltransferase involved in cell wall biosynthesis
MLARLISRTLPPGVELTFHASGASYRAFKQAAMHTLQAGVTLGGPLNTKEWAREMARCHIAIVTLRPGAERVMMPSKTYSAMLAGQAVIAACERSSDLADLIVDAGCGWIVDPEDDQGVWDALADAARDANRLGELQRRAQLYARRHFDMKVVVDRWSALLGTISEGRASNDPVRPGGQ